MTEDRKQNPVGGTALDTRDLLGELIRAAGKRQPPPASDYQQTLAAATAVWQRKVRSRHRRRAGFGIAGAVAASLVVALVLSQYWPAMRAAPAGACDRIMGVVSLRSPSEEDWSALGGEPIEIGSRLRTGPDGRTGIILASGVSLRLHGSTEVLLASPREIELFQGRVYVDTHGSVRPEGAITVVTATGTFRDIGTQFEVRRRDDAMRLRVRDGIVSLRMEDRTLRGVAGEQLKLDESGDLTRSAIARDDPDWQWVETLAPAPRLENLPVIRLLEWVRRETGREFVFDGPAVKARAFSTTLHGSVDKLSPLEALDVMLATTDFDYLILADGSISISEKMAASE